MNNDLAYIKSSNCLSKDETNFVDAFQNIQLIFFLSFIKLFSFLRGAYEGDPKKREREEKRVFSSFSNAIFDDCAEAECVIWSGSKRFDAAGNQTCRRSDA